MTMMTESTDEEILLEIERTARELYVEKTNGDLPAEIRSAFKAVLHAMHEPGCLVRVTCNRRQALPTVEALMAVLTDWVLLDTKKTIRAALDAGPGANCQTLELLNGSGIEIVF